MIGATTIDASLADELNHLDSIDFDLKLTYPPTLFFSGSSESEGQIIGKLSKS